MPVPTISAFLIILTISLAGLQATLFFTKIVGAKKESLNHNEIAIDIRDLIFSLTAVACSIKYCFEYI